MPPNPDAESVSWLRFLFASTTVIGLMGLLAWALKYVSAKGWGVKGNAPTRLQILSTTALDPRRRVVLLKCDQTEYVLLLGPHNDLLLSASPSSPASKTP